MSLAAAKNSFRQHYRHLRNQLSIEQQVASSQSISRLFLESSLAYKKNIAVYLARDGEIDLRCLVEKLWQTQCSVFLPVIHSGTQQLYFVQYFKSSIMKKNQYGIDEPENIFALISPEDIDIVFMPLVAFDDNGIRLGMGKGYYDKSFSFCRYPHDKPLLVGVAYQCQHCEALPEDEWDVPLDAVITEKKLFIFNEGL